MPILISVCFMMLAGHVAFTPQIRREARICLTVFLLLFGLQVGILIAEFFWNTLPALEIKPISAALLPPLCYLALNLGLRASPGAKKRDLFHLLPVALVSITLLMPGLTGVSVDWLIILTQWIYGCLLIRIALRKGNRHNWPVSLAFGILFLIIGAIDIWITIHISAGGQLTSSPGLLPALGVIFLVVTSLMIATIRRPDLISSAVTALQETSNALTPAVASDASSEQELAATMAKIDECLDRKRPYKEETFGLAWLAAETSLSARQVSIAIKQVKGKGFSAYINDWKVEEASTILVSPEWKKRSITEVMFEAGFYTKSSFNKEFRRRTGMSPSEFRAVYASKV